MEILLSFIMDFGSLLQAAKQNAREKKEVRTYNTSFSAPKREEKKAKSLSANIQKFLARKEAEEKQKSRDAQRKRDELLALRSQDKKATRRVNVMLKRTKSANQSVIEDAVDNDNTAVTLVGPSQPDEDDYGYVSQEAAAFYNKMMEKYSKIPDDPKFSLSKKSANSNLSKTKDRVKAALEKEKEALLPHGRKRKHKEPETVEESNDYGNTSSNTSSNAVEEKKDEPKKAKTKMAAPPPMNFEALLKLAAAKQHEPIVIEVKPKEKETPMTKKQKKEFERYQQWKDKKLNTKEQDEISVPKTNQVDKEKRSISNKLTPKHDKSSIAELEMRTKQKEQTEAVLNKNMLPKSDSRSYKSDQRQQIREQISKTVDVNSRQTTPKQKPMNNPISKSSLQKSRAEVKGPAIKKNLTHEKPVSATKPISKPSISANSIRRDDPSKSKEAYMIKKDKEMVKKSADQLRRLPPKDISNKQFASPNIQKREPLLKSNKQKQLPNKRIAGRIYDDDEEYDSEMDDFIDDDVGEGEDYSKYIKDIFGYDKSKYRGVDEDDDNMVSTFAQQMREDIRSTKIGIMEDLEDIQREKDEKRRKAILKKRKF